jgi:hypothetical protein
MAFMQPQVVGPQKWWRFDTAAGVQEFPGELLKQPAGDPLNDKDFLEAALQYLEHTFKVEEITEVEVVEGYGARMSAPGYMDCTEWSVFDTEEEAREYLVEEEGICPVCYKNDMQEDSKGRLCVHCVQSISNEGLEEALREVVKDEDLLSVPGVYEIVREHYNNEMLQKAYDNLCEANQTLTSARLGV